MLVPEQEATGAGFTVRVEPVLVGRGSRLWRDVALPDPEEAAEPPTSRTRSRPRSRPKSRSMDPCALRRPPRSPACLSTWYIRSTSSVFSVLSTTATEQAECQKMVLVATHKLDPMVLVCVLVVCARLRGLFHSFSKNVPVLGDKKGGIYWCACVYVYVSIHGLCCSFVGCIPMAPMCCKIWGK